MGFQSISLRIIAIVILFFVMATGILSYSNYLSVERFTQKSEREKGELLMASIEPVVAIDLYLGMDDPMRDYLDKIVHDNPLLINLAVTDDKGNPHYHFHASNDIHGMSEPIRFERTVYDKTSNHPIGSIELEYSNAGQAELLGHYKIFTFQMLGVSLLLVVILSMLLHRTFQPLRSLAQDLASFDPKKFNFTKKKIDRGDEVSVIHNAVVDMVEKMRDYTKQLSQLNIGLEKRIEERTRSLKEINDQLRTEIEERIRAEEALKQANILLEKLSTRDALTGLYNRRVFEERLTTFWRTALRDKSPISMVLCDIDHFKNINDSYGHPAGDLCLREMAAILEKTISRPMDMVARYGGEEFIFILPDTPVEGAKKIADEIQALLKARNEKPQTSIKMTCSIGVTSVVPSSGISELDLLKETDRALYEAKRGGRNRIVVHILDKQ